MTVAEALVELRELEAKGLSQLLEVRAEIKRLEKLRPTVELE